MSRLAAAHPSAFLPPPRLPMLPNQPPSTCRYSEAIALQPGKDALPALHSNRSLAYCKAGHSAEVLADADAAAALAPAWHKAQWRRAAALTALRRDHEAALAHREAWRLARGSDAEAEAAARLWAAVQRLPREQLGRALLAELGELQAVGRLGPPCVEAATEQELEESMFRLLRAAHQGRPRPGPYYRR